MILISKNIAPRMPERHWNIMPLCGVAMRDRIFVYSAMHVVYSIRGRYVRSEDKSPSGAR